MTIKSAISIADKLKVLFLLFIILREISKVSIIEYKVKRDLNEFKEESFIFVDNDILIKV